MVLQCFFQPREDLRRRAGDAPGALAAYDEGLEIARSLAARDPENAL